LEILDAHADDPALGNLDLTDGAAGSIALISPSRSLAADRLGPAADSRRNRRLSPVVGAARLPCATCTTTDRSSRLNRLAT